MVRYIRVIAFAVVTIITVSALSLYLYYQGSVGQEIRIRISTTTSLYSTGLLSYLAEEFSKIHSNVRLDFIAVGTGAALKLAEHSDACAVFVHAPSIERRYIDRGIITGGRIIAYNYFIIVGPVEDPAGVNKSRDVLAAFRSIYATGDLGKAFFITRGDNSGTNVRELSLWSRSGLDPSRKGWYKNCGCSMDQALVMANEFRAYTLSDAGTYMQFKRAGRLPNLEILYANATDPNMINIYSIYIVSSCKGDVRKYAEEFRDFVYSNQEKLIGNYGVSRYGAPLFYPARDKAQENQVLWRELASEEKE
ncbi:MAG: substrate-binding domain-containing protein [Sulfolobales archaeon]